MAFSARKRGNPFVARSRQRRQAERAATQPKSSSEPTSAQPDPQPETTPASKFAVGGYVEQEAPLVGDDGAPGNIKPLGDLREVAERAEASASRRAAAASVGIEHDMDTDEVLKVAGEAERVKRGRGRPRPQETIDRDEAVHGLLLAQPEGISKADIAEILREKEQQVYSSLRQLSKEGRATTRHVKDVGYRWFAKDSD